MGRSTGEGPTGWDDVVILPGEAPPGERPIQDLQRCTTSTLGRSTGERVTGWDDIVILTRLVDCGGGLSRP